MYELNQWMVSNLDIAFEVMNERMFTLQRVKFCFKMVINVSCCCTLIEWNILLHRRHFKPWPSSTNVQKWSSICFRLMLDLVCCVQTNLGTMRLTIAPPWVQRRWSSKRRREGGNGGRRMRRRRRRVEEHFYWYLACVLFLFILILFFLTPNVKAWRTLWSVFHFLTLLFF